MIRVGDPNYQVLARTDQHAVDVAELDCGYSRRVEVQQAHLLPRLDVPNDYLLLAGLTSSNQVPTVGREAGFKDRPRSQFIERARKLVLELTFEGVDEDDDVLRGAKQNELTVRAELQLLHFCGPVLVVDREY